MKIIKSLEKSGLVMKSISERIKTEARKEKDGFLGMLLGTLSASLLLCPLTVKAKIPGRGVMRAGKGKFEILKNQLKQARIFYAASSFT